MSTRSRVRDLEVTVETLHDMFHELADTNYRLMKYMGVHEVYHPEKITAPRITVEKKETRKYTKRSTK